MLSPARLTHNDIDVVSTYIARFILTVPLHNSPSNAWLSRGSLELYYQTLMVSVTRQSRVANCNMKMTLDFNINNCGL